MTVFHNNRDLLDRFRRGDPKALETVYLAYVDVVTDVARRGVIFVDGRRVSGVPAHDVVDLVQEVFVRAFRRKARETYDGLRDYRPYLMTICRNLVVDWIRKRGREIPTEDVLDLLGVENATGVPGSDQEREPWADPAIVAAVERYVAGLDEPLAAVYEQRFRKGASQAAAADALGIGRQRLRTVETRIRQGLREALASDWPAS